MPSSTSHIVRCNYVTICTELDRRVGVWCVIRAVQVIVWNGYGTDYWTDNDALVVASYVTAC